MTFDTRWKFSMRTEQVKQEVHDAMFQTIKEVVELDIKPEAQRLTPVKFGHNRRSIDTDVERGVDGKVVATIYTQSGYGGYLELGTSRMAARPYLWPAFNKFRAKLGKILGYTLKKVR